MARYFFNGDVSAASQRETFQVFTDEALTSAATDLLSEDGSAVTVVTRGMDFYGPDGVTILWGRVSNDTDVAPVRFDATDAPADSGSSASAGTPVVRAFPFAFDTPDLLTGAALYTPTIGDILLDAWIEIDTAWNGTTPKVDFGAYDLGASVGIFASVQSGVDLTIGPDSDYGTGALLSSENGSGSFSSLSGLNILVGNASNTRAFRVVPGKLLGGNPLKLVVSQNGNAGGADPGSTQGSAVLYLVTATPVAA